MSLGASQTTKCRGKHSTPSLNNDMAGQYQTQASRLFGLQRQGGLDQKGTEVNVSLLSDTIELFCNCCFNAAWRMACHSSQQLILSRLLYACVISSLVSTGEGRGERTDFFDMRLIRKRKHFPRFYRVLV